MQLPAQILKLPQWLCGKESSWNAGDSDSIPGLRRCPGGGHGKPLQYSCLENPMDRGDWPASRLNSIGLQRVGHDWSDLACTHAQILPGGKGRGIGLKICYEFTNSFKKIALKPYI